MYLIIGHPDETVVVPLAELVGDIASRETNCLA